MAGTSSNQIDLSDHSPPLRAEGSSSHEHFDKADDHLSVGRISSQSSSSQLRRSPGGHSGLVPSPRASATMLPPPSISKSDMLPDSHSIATSSSPRILSRASSLKEKAGRLSRRRTAVKQQSLDDEVSPFEAQSGSVQGTDPSEMPRRRSDTEVAEVIETPQLRLERDPHSGRKMINQYLVLQEIGHGTHGRVRLGKDLSGNYNAEGVTPVVDPDSSTYYAIKIVDRTSKRKRLTGFSRQKSALARNEGGKMFNEAEIRKEIAIFKKVNHPNVVRMKEIIDDPESSKLFMILEYCEGGEVHWRDADSSPALTLAEIRQVFRDTLLGLEYLHHQGIIHRDIKPSNLLRASDGTVKISDFGCSHYSEALRDASSLPNSEAEILVDDIELAKTAGSPAFFAPEMCFSGFETEETEPPPPLTTPKDTVPALTLRPPPHQAQYTAIPEDEADSNYDDRSPDSAAGSSVTAVPSSSTRPANLADSPQPQRLPITNAIDVWALGVTLYCLLFGKTPFDAPNEYLLMQIIPKSAYVVPPFMGKDHRSTTGSPQKPIDPEVEQCLDLLSKLLQKNATARISLEQAKRHPFTLYGLADPTTWLASTDPHAQTFVTVSNDEVAAVVTKSTSFRDRFRKGIKSISNKLQIFSGPRRSRARSIGAVDAETPSSAIPSPRGHSVQPGTPSTRRTTPSSQSLIRSPIASPPASPPQQSSLMRRLSLRNHKSPEASGRRRPSQLASSPSFTSLAQAAKPISGAVDSVVPQRSLSSQSDMMTHNDSWLAGHSDSLLSPHPPRSGLHHFSPDSFPGSQERSTTSASSLENLDQPTKSEMSSGQDLTLRGRSTSNTSTSNASIGRKVVRLLSRTGSQRSKSRPMELGDSFEPTPSSSVAKLQQRRPSSPPAGYHSSALSISSMGSASDISHLNGASHHSHGDAGRWMDPSHSPTSVVQQHPDEDDVDWTGKLSDEDDVGQVAEDEEEISDEGRSSQSKHEDHFDSTLSNVLSRGRQAERDLDSEDPDGAVAFVPKRGRTVSAVRKPSLA